MDKFWFDKMSVLLCEGPKPPNSMISGFLNPSGPLLIDLNLPNYLTKYMSENMETFLENTFFANDKFEIPKFQNRGPDLEQTGTNK